MFNFYEFVYGIDWLISQDCKKNNNSIALLKKTVLSCVKCRLAENRTNVVFGEGNLHARLMFIGEGPGAEEDIEGRPFVGRAGKLLDKMILAMGLTRKEVYIANIVKCRPPDNRAPFRDEAELCKPYLIEQINMINFYNSTKTQETNLSEQFGLCVVQFLAVCFQKLTVTTEK